MQQCSNQIPIIIYNHNIASAPQFFEANFSFNIMSFGFSVGDFVAALELVGTVVNALRASGGSGSEYRELVNQLYSLETALLRVKQLELEEEQRSEYIALRQSASQCQRTIDEFWEKTKKYQKHLRTEGSSSKLKDGWMKIKWAKCKQGDLIRFKADLAAHSQSISIILSALQVVRNTCSSQAYLTESTVERKQESGS